MRDVIPVREIEVFEVEALDEAVFVNHKEKVVGFFQFPVFTGLQQRSFVQQRFEDFQRFYWGIRFYEFLNSDI